MLEQALTEKYSWINEIEAWTVAVIRGRSVPEVVETYEGDPVPPSVTTQSVRCSSG